MLARVRLEAPAARISVELEKPRPGVESLLAGPQLLLIARGFAQAQGCGADPAGWLSRLRDRSGAWLAVLGWGGEGAWLAGPDGPPIRVPACPPARVLDTLGAGDTLNAGMIDGLIRALAPEEALRRAVALAGLKCGRPGLDGLGEAARVAGIL
jgi:ketohexokinase